MGEFVKKWMAGIGAAAVVVIIAAIAIGRMDHKDAAKTATSNPVGTSSVVTPQAAQPSAPMASQAAPAVPPAASAPAANIQTAPATSTPTPSTPPQVAQAVQPQHARATHTQSSQLKLPPTTTAIAPASSQAEAGQSTAPTSSQAQVQTAQAPSPVSPPDTPMPPVQQLAAPDTAAQTMQVDLASGMRTTGSVSVNGNFTKSSTLVHSADHIVTPGQNGALVTDTGNAVAPWAECAVYGAT